MSKLLFAILYVVIIACALRKERCKFRTPSSPLFLILMANFGITILYALTQNWLGFHKLQWTTVYILLRGSFFFAVISLLFTASRVKILKNRNLQYVTDRVGNPFKVIAILSIVFMLYSVSQYGIANILGNDDVAAAFFGRGLGGHVLVFQTFLLTHILGRKFEIINVPIIVLLFFCLFMYNVKAWIIIPCLIGWFIHRDLNGRKINAVWFGLIILVVFCIFSISYFISLGWDLDNMAFIWAHFCKYIYAGIGGLNEAVIQEYPIGKTPYAGLPSFINILFSIDVKSWYQFDYMVINDINGEYTNVLSLFGTTFYVNGPIIGTIYIFVLSTISYMLYSLRLNTHNYWFYLSYYMWASGLILSFFGNYYKLLNTWELTFYAFFIGVLFSQKGNRFYKQNG